MKKNTQHAVFAALFTAITCILSQVTVAVFPIPFTLQTFAVALCGFYLPAKWALASTAVYAAIGACGLPVFSGFKGGFQVLIGPTGGFIFGFVFMAWLCSLAFRRAKKVQTILLALAGLAVCHILGVAQFSLVSGTPVLTAVLTASLPFLLKDVLSVLAAYFAVKALKKRLPGNHS